MRPDELQAAIVRPATVGGVAVEPALVAELVAGVSDRPAALPLLQFSLTELYERRVADVMLLETRTLPLVGKAWTAIAWLLFLIFVSVTQLLEPPVAVVTAAVGCLLTGCVSVRGAYEAVDWRVIVLLGSMIAYGVALEQTGTAELLARAVAEREGLVLEDRILSESTLSPPPGEPDAVWYRYLLLALGVLAAAWLAARRVPATVMARAWFAFGGLFGLAILFFWFGTDHRVAGLNMNVLVFNPLWLLFVFGNFSRSWVQQAVVLFSVLALAAAVSPVQYMADVVAAFVPLNLAAARVLQKDA